MLLLSLCAGRAAQPRLLVASPNAAFPTPPRQFPLGPLAPGVPGKLVRQGSVTFPCRFLPYTGPCCSVSDPCWLGSGFLLLPIWTITPSLC